MSKAKDYYKILQVSSQATSEEIKIAFRRLARQYHPDLHPNDPFCEEKFKEISEAYKILINQKNSFQNPDKFQTNNQSKSLSVQDIYLRGVKKTLAKNYVSALSDYDQAIQLKPDFLEAYIKRCEVYFYLDLYQKSLEDSQTILRLDSRCFEAYYYQGRSRHKLGYLPGAIEAYTQSINIQNTSAKSYYYRSFAYEELKEQKKAISDIKKAINLFKIQEDLKGVELGKNRLNSLNNHFNQLWRIWDYPLINICQLFLSTGIMIVIDPGGNFLSCLAKLQSIQRLIYGIFYGIVFNIISLHDFYFNQSKILFNQSSDIYLFVLGISPFLALLIISLIAQLMYRNFFYFVSSVFFSGVSLLPFMGFLILEHLLIHEFYFIKTIALIFTGCYTLLILYNGCLQVYNFSEKMAAFWSSIMLIVVGIILGILI
ncbi:DnaJ domain-containing protein [Crocosphaera sp. UHCC 0190]|uniref:DnaJ domain-containing protein n=1 Tax=Crocosphaera sp. UHCC 0190 TaxID=3110246 RepID=UPI002B1FA68B|nr:DnaJ domain-containing protein [Crocosphaera sp. UHCC 0190]MEA5510962.1 DnaJ domain-containing protein [Crocosphaera sp. UHCC 0190]